MYAVPASVGDASMLPIQVSAGRPGTRSRTFVHVAPSSRVICTLPSSVPTQITPGSNSSSAMVRIVVWNSAAVLSR